MPRSVATKYARDKRATRSRATLEDYQKKIEFRLKLEVKVHEILHTYFVLDESHRVKAYFPIQVVATHLKIGQSNELAVVVKDLMVKMGAKKTKLRGRHWYVGIRYRKEGIPPGETISDPTSFSSAP